MMEVTTARLLVRPLAPSDDTLILALLNDPDFLRNIGDRGVHSLDDARGYISTRSPGSFAHPMLGVYVVDERDSGAPTGIITLFRRDYLPDVDLGFAFLPAFRRRGYAHEASAAAINSARASGAWTRLLAIAQPANLPSVRLLARLGFAQESTIVDTDGATVAVFTRSL
jgi:ribosomal-protein-alanine N-acetyltransferase